MDDAILNGIQTSDEFITMVNAKQRIAEYEKIIADHGENSERAAWGRQEIERLTQLMVKYRNHFIEKAGEAATPLVSDDNRLEIIMLVVGNDRAEALDAIGGIFLAKVPFKLTVYENSLNTMNTSKVWNKLIRESTCPYVMLIDSDAVPTGDSIDQLMKVVQNHQDAAVIAPVSGSASMVTTMQRTNYRAVEEEQVHGHVSGYCMVFRKSIFDELGYFDEDFVFYGQDSDWIERVLEQQRYKILLVHRAVVTHGRDGEASIASSRMEKEGKFLRHIDAEYSKWLFDFKKGLRMAARSLPSPIQPGEAT